MKRILVAATVTPSAPTRLVDATEERALQLMSRRPPYGKEEDCEYKSSRLLHRKMVMAKSVAARPVIESPAQHCMVHVGCSGWTYKSWRGRFYPDALPASRWLEHYASGFDCVETNGTFYRLPETRTFAAWAARTPPRFRMAVKASRFLTHMKRLIAPAEPLQRLLTRAAALGEKLGPILYQLPPDFQRNDDRLRHFVTALPRTIADATGKRVLRHVIEFRDPSWYVGSTYDLLAAHDVTMCLHDKLGAKIEAPAVGPILYVRFHGRGGEYVGRYSRPTLLRWADRIAAARGARDVWAFFNNDPDAAAVGDAAALRAALCERLACQR